LSAIYVFITFIACVVHICYRIMSDGKMAPIEFLGW
jgi:hypothetical protein